jgi:hypothetical protein
VQVQDGRKFNWNFNHFHSLGTLIRDESLEPLESQTLRNLIKPGDTLIDIEAHFGWYTTLMSKLTGPSGKVIPFEPLPNMFEELEKNIILNGMTNIQTECSALLYFKERIDPSTFLFLVEGFILQFFSLMLR